jgi:hypothetical protein
MSKSYGWETYEIIYYGIPNFNFAGHSGEEARRLVREGKMRWAMCHGGALTLVPLNYELKMWENFVVETKSGTFELVK